MHRKRLITTLLFLAGVSSAAFAVGQNLEQSISDLAHRWAAASYATPDAAKEAAFESAAASARQLSQSFPGTAEPLIWQAIILASEAKVEGGLAALHKAKEARDLLLTAESINPKALDGSVYTSLGSLYAKVPGWPIGFGDKKKARAYLEKAISISPNGIDSNYFYADYLADQGDYSRSVEYLKRALAAAPRPGREDADAGRRREASDLLESLKEKHGDQIANQ